MIKRFFKWMFSHKKKKDRYDGLDLEALKKLQEMPTTVDFRFGRNPVLGDPIERRAKRKN